MTSEDKCLVVALDQLTSIEEALVIERQLIRDNHDYADVPNVSVTSPYRSAVIQYIARYVVRMVRKRVNCPVCVSAEAGETLHPSRDKNRGGLVKASESVVRVCHETEKCFEFMMKATSGKLPHCKDLEHVVSSAVLANTSSTGEGKK